MKTFAQKFAVEKPLVMEYVKHLENQGKVAEIRQRGRKRKREEKKRKAVEDYNWKELVEAVASNMELQVKELEMRSAMRYARCEVLMRSAI